MDYFSRPKGTQRFQELSTAKQPLPSAELDNELNRLVNFINAYYSQASTAPVARFQLDATTGDVNQVLPADGEVLIFREDATANHVYLTALTPGDTVMGQATAEVYLQYECLRLLKIGTDWRKIN